MHVSKNKDMIEIFKLKKYLIYLTTISLKIVVSMDAYSAPNK